MLGGVRLLWCTSRHAPSLKRLAAGRRGHPRVARPVPLQRARARCAQLCRASRGRSCGRRDPRGAARGRGCRRARVEGDALPPAARQRAHRRGEPAGERPARAAQRGDRSAGGREGRVANSCNTMRRNERREECCVFRHSRFPRSCASCAGRSRTLRSQKKPGNAAAKSRPAASRLAHLQQCHGAGYAAGQCCQYPKGPPAAVSCCWREPTRRRPAHLHSFPRGCECCDGRGDIYWPAPYCHWRCSAGEVRV